MADRGEVIWRRLDRPAPKFSSKCIHPLAIRTKPTPLLKVGSAVPAERLAYFTHRDCFDGNRSRLGVFERNWTKADEVLEHPNYLKHLRYFVHGSRLPFRVQNAIRETVGDPRHFTSGDLEPVRVLARQLVRQQGLDAASADAFF